MKLLLLPYKHFQLRYKPKCRHHKLLKASYSSKELEDLKMHNSWTLSALFQAMFKIAYDPEAQKEADSFLDRKIVDNPAEAVVLRADLENPLVQKYKFDVTDFYTGAKTATQKIIEAAFSKEFKDYIWKRIETSSEHDFLHENISPITYMKIVGWNIEDMNTKYRFPLSNLKVHSFKMIRVMTFMHHDEQAWDSLSSPLVKNVAYYVSKFFGFHQESYIPFISSLSPPKPSTSATSTEHHDTARNTDLSDDKLKEWYISFFPPGSVMIGVTVNFNIDMTMGMQEKVPSTSSSGDGEWKDHPSVAKNLIKFSFPSTASYLGCVSGQKELEWKLVKLDMKFEKPKPK